MQFRHKEILLFCLMMMGSVSLMAQSPANSPYSRFGIGDIKDPDLTHQRAMGGLSAAYVDPFQINIINPASLSFLRATSFQFGLFARRAGLNDGTNSSSSWSGGLEYFSIAFPLRNPINETFDRIDKPYSLGMSFSLLSNSRVDYNISSIEFAENIGEIERNYNGSGGTNKFIWGNSLKFKDISFGVNLGYLFGKINYERNIFFNDIVGSRDNNFVTDYSISSFLFNTGVIYHKTLNEAAIEANKQTPARRISIGAHFTPKKGFATNTSEIKRTIYRFTEFTEFEDTLSLVTDIEGNGTLPMEFGFGGVYYYGDKLALGVNYLLSKWSQYTNSANPGTLGDGYKVSFGGFYRPNTEFFNSYYKRLFYRFGLYYSKDPRVINGESLKTYGLNFGVGLPIAFQRRFSHINLGFDIGRKGPNTPISETFVKFSLDFTFNDNEWFLKRKLE